MMSETLLPAKDVIEVKAAELRTKMQASSTKSEFAEKVSAVRNSDCSEDEFNIWHAAKDNNSARTPWGTLPTGRK